VFRRRFKAVASAVLNGAAHVTVLARKGLRCGHRRLQHRQADSPAFLFAEPVAETAHGFNYITGFAELFA
jgi:hypothetical protein